VSFRNKLKIGEIPLKSNYVNLLKIFFKKKNADIGFIVRIHIKSSMESEFK